jgi:hypothetical protein
VQESRGRYALTSRRQDATTSAFRATVGAGLIGMLLGRNILVRKSMRFADFSA